MNTIPSISDRDRNVDLLILARYVVKERLSWSNDVLNSHVADSPDLLMHFVTRALGAEFNVSWSQVSDEEAPAVCAKSKAWSDYCGDLFGSVPEFVLSKLV